MATATETPQAITTLTVVEKIEHVLHLVRDQAIAEEDVVSIDASNCSGSSLVLNEHAFRELFRGQPCRPVRESMHNLYRMVLDGITVDWWQRREDEHGEEVTL